MLEAYFPLIIMVVFGFAVAFIFMLLSQWLGARRGTKEKQTVYESGMVPYGNARERFSVKFYLVAVSFIVFDIEVVFLYPWAIQFKELGIVPFIAVLIFIAILFIGYFYEYKKGGLKWD
ncbi:MAG: dehydrogenase subunit [Ignavibacteria bacterium]|nr:dehydrogenase subunit [Ignavibacteria bacterium]